MEALIQLAKRVKNLRVDAVMYAIVQDRRFRDLIIDYNTERQLYDKGIDSEGKRLRSAITGLEDYTLYTLAVKESKGQKTDNITLKDTGEFYESWTVTLSGGDIVINADLLKGDNNLEEVWGPILGLTDENLQHVIDYARENIVIPFVLRTIYGEA